jgi:hypothetical protein
MVLAYLTFFTGVAISAVAIYYSVLGLAAIFAAAVIPIVVMGTTLEVAKLVTAWWLKSNWHRAPRSIKAYLTIAVVTLMLITSMGIFGFLSKAHTDQAVPLGDTAAQVAFIDEKINNEREIIANARSLIKQLDDAVMGIQTGEGREIRAKDGSVRVENPAERALQVRRAQARDRAALTTQIEEAQSRIVKLQEEKAPIAGKLRAVEAEVGPIKYIAKLIYGDNPDQNILEKAVVWVIVIIVFVFDPLAVLLLLASQMSFVWARQEKERTDELVQETTPQERNREETSPQPQPIIRTIDEGSRGESQPAPESSSDDDVAEEANRKIAEIEPEQIEPDLSDVSKPLKLQIIPDLEKELAKKDDIDLVIEPVSEIEDLDDDEIIDYASLENKPENIEKKAIHRWKDENPESSIKRQRKLLEEKFIDRLPWQDYMDEYQAEYEKSLAKDYIESIEQTEEIRVKPDLTEVIEPQGYIQNSEQNDSTLWKKIQDKK